MPYNFVERAGRYVFVIFIIWSALYIVDRWVLKTKILLNCCSLPLALLAGVLFEFIIGYALEID